MGSFLHLPSRMKSEIVRSGVLYKRGSGEGAFQRRNWKPRYVELTFDRVHYYDYCQGTLKGTIDISLCTLDDIQIMPEDCMKTGKSDSTIWRVAIATPDRRLILSMQTEAEMNSWVASFKYVIGVNAMERKSCPAFTFTPKHL
ncbi:unnamed protein product [Aphanomyces euteiches]